MRFSGFDEPWEQRKLKELSDFITKGATPTTYGFEWQASGIPFFRNDALKDNQFIYGDYSYISEEANEVLQRSEIHGDDILIAITGDIGKVGIVPKNIVKGNINQHTARIRIVKDAIPYFVYQSLITEVHQKRYQIIKTGLSMPQLSLEQIRETVVFCPSLSEQYIISLYFEQLDHLITLHQHKIDILKKYKSSLLQQMFPQNGELVPQLRFSGFTIPWEQHKVGDFLTESRVRGNTGFDAKKLSVKLWGKGVVEKNDSGGSKHTQYFTRRKGQFIYSKLDFLNSAFGVIPENLDNYESTADLPAFDLDGMNPYFMFFIAIQENFYLKHGSIADGSRKAKRIHTDTFLNMPVVVPTIDEQNLIVECLQHFDRLITLHQQQLDLYQKYKKGLLQNIFV